MTQYEQLTTEERTRAAFYALRVLSEDETNEFRRQLLQSPLLRRYVASLEPVTEVISDLIPQIRPPAALKARLMERIQSLPPVSKGETPGPERSEAPQQSPISVVYGSKAPWMPSGMEGISVKVLHVDPSRQRKTLLVKVAPGCSYPSHQHAGPEESLVLEGDLQRRDLTLGPGDFQRAEADSVHEPQFTVGGCILLVNASLGDKTPA